MRVNSVRAPNRSVLIVAGIALLLLAALAIGQGALVAREYQLPLVVTAGPAMRNAILGIALLYVAFSRSQFAGVTAVIVATIIMFVVVGGHLMSLALGLSARVTWLTAIYLVIAAVVLWPSMFPWNWTANKPAFFWMALTLGVFTTLSGSVALIARL